MSAQINDWKKQALAALPAVFGQCQHREFEEREADRDRLYQQIGNLQVESVLAPWRATCAVML